MSHESGGIIGWIPLDNEDNFIIERTAGVILNVKLKIEVFDDEGDFIPHLHITSDDNKIDCCACIAHPRFFLHGTHTKKLNNKKQAEILNQWLSEHCHRFNFEDKTNWEFIAASWSPISLFDKEMKQPDYSLLFDNPFKLNFTAMIKPTKKNIKGYSCFEGTIKERKWVKAIILSNKSLYNNTKVKVLSVIEENFSNNEIYICVPIDEKIKLQEKNSFILDVVKYFKISQHQIISENDY